MRERLEEYAPYFGALGLGLWAAALILKLLNQPAERIIALLVVGALALALYIFGRPAQVREAVTSRGARYGSNALIASVAFIGIIGILNFLGMRYHYRQDLTANQTFTLSPLTVQVLQGLKEPIQATAFFASTGFSSENRQQVEDRLKEYRNHSDKFSYRFIDPQADPQIARDYKAGDGMVVFERGTRRENALQTDEQSLTNAMVKVTQDTQPVIYFTTGHGEHSLDDTGDNGYSFVKQGLETENYKTAALNLKTVTSTLPSDISALVIAGPTQKFEADEVKHVKDYLDKNGRVLILIDPQTDTGLEDLLQAWGLKLRNDVIIDPRFGLQGQVQVPVISSYKTHAVTKDLEGISTFYVGARSLTVAASPPVTRTATSLFTSSDQSWGETDLAALKNQNVQFDASADVKGPLDMAYAVETSGGGENPARLIVFGNSTFVSNRWLTRAQSGNPILFDNGVNWLAGQENLIAIPAKASDQHPVFLTGEQTTFVFWSSFLLIPAAILIIGALIWWRRR
jgi:ABC-type uncharacterized transport system involved in gliding motility auxiliary subunit